MTHPLEFVKMEAAGNDFVLIDCRNQDIPLEAIITMCPALCDRKRGIGADGLLLLHPNPNPDVDYTMIYRNSDGSDAGMCGNGGRSIALYASQHGFSDHHSFQVHNQIYHAFVNPAEHLVELSFPDAKAPNEIEDTFGTCFQVYPNTEHAVFFLETLPKDIGELTTRALEIRNHARFSPVGTNVNFAVIRPKNEIELETFERGVEDFTLACGTGAVATAMSAHALNGSEAGSHTYSLRVKGGVLKVSFSFEPSLNEPVVTDRMVPRASVVGYKSITLEGPAKVVFKGTWSGH